MRAAGDNVAICHPRKLLTGRRWCLPQRLEKAARECFKEYDVNGNGLIDKDELKYVLADLGMLDGLPAAQLGTFLDEEFARADVDGSGELDFQEFTKYYNSVMRFRTANEPDAGTEEGGALHTMYLEFCSFGSSLVVEEMDGAKFAKFCRDSKMLSKRFTPTDVDIIYAKAKTKGKRKFNYAQFVNALGLCAEVKGVQMGSLVHKVLEVGGPESSGTKGEYNKFHDDKSTYTGVYSRGGPTKIDHETGAGMSLSNMVNNKTGQSGGHASKLKNTKSGGGTDALAAAMPAKKMGLKGYDKPTEVDAEFPTGCLTDTFAAFANFGSGNRGAAELDGGKFAKAVRDAKMLSRKFTPTSVDIIFSKVKDKGARKIGYKQFEIAVQLMCQEMKKDYSSVVAKLQGAAPVSTGTKGEYNKFHDDKSTYTGVYARGGPTNIDRDTGAAMNLADMCNNKK